ncbi:MAG: hypothetical protein ACE5FA_00085 [Dehalococcoidia bacterium]
MTDHPTTSHVPLDAITAALESAKADGRVEGLEEAIRIVDSYTWSRLKEIELRAVGTDG